MVDNKKNWHPIEVVDFITTALSEAANSSNAFYMKKYMKGHFDYYGVKSPIQKDIITKVYSAFNKPNKSELIATIQALWDIPYRECQYIACHIAKKHIKFFDKSDIDFIIDLIKKKSWWDTVDSLASNLIGQCLMGQKDLQYELCDHWIKSEHMWTRRTAIIFQLKYKKQTDFELLKSLILDVAHEKEFFIRKASGWALRDYSRVSPHLVMEFIEEYQSVLSPLTIKEGKRLMISK